MGSSSERFLHLLLFDFGDFTYNISVEKTRTAAKNLIVNQESQTDIMPMAINTLRT